VYKNIIAQHTKERELMEKVLNSLYDAIVAGDASRAPGLVQQALDSGLPAPQILIEAMISAMNHVGKMFEEGEFFIPEMLIAARAMQAGLAVLKPHLMQADVKATGRVVAGTVKGDLHDIGKNLVCMLLEGAGFEIIDLGTDVVPEKFVEVVKEGKADIVALSALLTTTMPNMKVTIEALKSAGVREKAKVIIGGAPLTQAYADQIGADGYAPDASRAVALAKSLMGV
jgi:5-methyltetrahydrofolate--homocysteine methyltransferase